jgi:hypothetical protein
VTQGIFSEHVPPDFADKGDIPAQSLCCDCLIGTLSARTHREFATEHRFTGERQRGSFYRHVGVAAAEYKDFLHISFSHSFSSFLRNRLRKIPRF